ncbi:CaiB/BaiF CoA transferase family protein [Pseudonocardia adelaidensis]|uniref:Formyl-CoA transferase n=1 Tax=Pseudonocardia adelaidensis TaxID=648754 RepID=A0ABP9NND1_9PSEU
MTDALAGLTVLELGQIYNGPYCGLLFAQLGADVIKLEPIGGERLRFRSTAGTETHEFVMLNSNKRSVTVDITHPRGREVLLDLVDGVDVVIENFAPGTMDRLGFAPEELCRRNPRLVYASGKGYGSTGPYAGMAAMDITVQAMAGVIASTGFPDGPPVKTGPAFIDFLGGIHLYAAAVTALLQRTVTGRGQLVEVSMHDTVYPTLASALGGLFNDPDNRPPERTGNRHSGLAIAPYNVYPAADGWLAIISLHERHLAGVLSVIGRPELIDDPRFADRHTRRTNVEALDSAISAWTSQQLRWDAVKALDASGVPCAPVLGVAEVAEDPHLVERGMIRTVEHPRLGAVPVPGCSLRLSDSPGPEPAAAPTLGTATDEVLAELCGYSADRIAALRGAGAVA